MRRTFNFTGRRRISRKDVYIHLIEGPPRHFGIRWSPEALDAPPDARVVVEAFTSGSPSIQRFEWGTVAHPQPPSQRSLDFAGGDNIAFNFKVIDVSEKIGRLLAIARNVHPVGDEDGGTGESLLPVNVCDLEQQVWRVSFEHDAPWLELNKHIDGIKQIARTNEQFFALVYPAVVRRILMQIVIVHGETDPDSDPDSWKCKWLRWARRLHPDGEGPPENANDSDEQFAWIEEVVGGFCFRFKAFSKYAADMPG